jgi:hypothetical protein
VVNYTCKIDLSVITIVNLTCKIDSRLRGCPEEPKAMPVEDGLASNMTISDHPEQVNTNPV